MLASVFQPVSFRVQAPSHELFTVVQSFPPLLLIAYVGVRAHGRQLCVHLGSVPGNNDVTVHLGFLMRAVNPHHIHTMK